MPRRLRSGREVIRWDCLVTVHQLEVAARISGPFLLD
jgi:hypothetical protein